MENQFNSDLAQAREERISTSLVGQLLMSEIPNLNLLYEDPRGIVVAHLWKDKYVIHSELYNKEPTMDDLRHAREVSNAIDKAFKEKGVEALYTWAENPIQDKYNKFLGYTPTGETVNSTFVDGDYPDEVREYKKDLV